MTRLACLALLLIAAPAQAAPTWPAPGAPLKEATLTTPKPKKPWRIYLDAGHGAPQNTGNRSVTCENEADVMLRIAETVAKRLEATGRFKVMLSRKGDELPRYQQRLASAADFRADAIVSFHSDARGEAYYWQPNPGQQCLRNDAEPGAGVLMSDEGTARLNHARARLARSLARQIANAGFPLYGGDNWMSLYDRDEAPGVFIDRRPLKQRVFILRKPKIPSVIVETHHALDFEEAARWGEARTLEAFADAFAVGLDEALRPEPKAVATGREK